ncbi:MAG: flagellar hook-basal body complex protein [Synechococcaceae cyanobacterium SM1_2_3]|nr:flagellar hook-basal body complex protein [Synechococcaceae cyanobacterium SM1_2_3]
MVPDFSKVLQIPGNTVDGTDNLSATQSVLATNSSADTDTIDATNASNYQYSSALTIYDSLGIDHTLNLYFRKTADNTWNVYRQFTEIESAAQKVGTLTFDSIGMPVRAMDSSGYMDPGNLLSLKMSGVTFGNGAGRQNIELDFANTTQFDSQSITNSLNQDGYTMGNLTGVSVDASGNIVASYSNDQSQIMGQVALARFANTQGLKRIGDNNWVATTESGMAVTGEPGVGLMGKLVTSALEGSNVELTKELVDMLVAQRSFQANSQVINTSGTLYQSILNIRS